MYVVESCGGSVCAFIRGTLKREKLCRIYIIWKNTQSM